MDLRFTPDELAFRDEVRTFFREALPADIRRKMELGQRLSKEDIVTLAAHPEREGLGRADTGRSNGAAPSWGAVKTLHLQGGDAARARARSAFLQRQHDRAGADRSSAPRSRSGASCRRSPISTTGSARASPSPAPAPTSPRSRPRRGSRAITTSSTARRSGPRARSTPTGCSASCAPTPSAKQQRGISYLLIDMKTPGLTVRPILTIDGEHHFNEVFFDDVRVPVENLVGEENKGWTYAKFLLGNERVGIARIGASKYRVQRAKELAAQVMRRRQAARGDRALPREARGARSGAEGARDHADARDCQLAQPAAGRAGPARRRC